MNYYDMLIDRAMNGGGGGGAVKIHEEDITVSTSSTSETTVKDFTISGMPVSGDTDKLVYVRIRDKAGWRDGYFYGSDNFGSPIGAWGGFANAVCGIRYYCHDNNGTIRYMGQSQASTWYGVYVMGLANTGGFRLSARYNSTSSRTIDGTFNIQVYIIPMTLFDAPIVK